MRLETFRGRDLSIVRAQARTALGEDAVIVSTRTITDGARPWIEVEVTVQAELMEFQRIFVPNTMRAFRPSNRKAYVVALVGPTGAGKTTTLAKLAVNNDAYGSKKVGLLTFDTYRAAAFEQLEAYAEAAELPCEVAYDAQELGRAMRRLSPCDVILVDTPGRGPKTDPARNQWRDLLRALVPDEVHLVVPATIRTDLVTSLRAEYSQLGVSHALLSKFDEVPADSRIAAHVDAIGLPMRWVTDGQEVPTDLRAAGPRVLGTLGMSAPLAKGAA